MKNKGKKKKLFFAVLLLCFLCASATEGDFSSHNFLVGADGPTGARGIGMTSLQPEDNPSMYNVIKENFNCNDSSIYIADSFYECVSDEAFYAFLEENTIDSHICVPDTFDCDDYALHFLSAVRRYCSENGMNAAIGMVWVDDHAVNFYVNSTYDVNLIDPQYDKTYIMENATADFVYI